MAKMSEFIAFKAAIELLKDRDMKDVIAAAYRKSKDQVGLPKEQMVNYVKEIYAPFTDEEISAKMPRDRLFTNPMKDCTRHVQTIRETVISAVIIQRRGE